MTLSLATIAERAAGNGLSDAEAMALAGITDFARAPRHFGVELGERWWRG